MSIATLRSDAHPLISEDHMFSAFVDSGLVTDLACFYDREQRRFTSVITLGPRTCGYKRITHGGVRRLSVRALTVVITPGDVCIALPESILAHAVTHDCSTFLFMAGPILLPAQPNCSMQYVQYV